MILDPQGNKNSVPVKVRQTSPDIWRCEYVSSIEGVHSVNVFFGGKSIPNSPYGVIVSPTSDPRKVRASGRGLQPSGVRVNDEADFKILTEGAGKGVADVKVIGPGGTNLPVNIEKLDGTTYEARYVPKKEGRHVVMVTYNDQEIYKSPFEVMVAPYKQSAIQAYGPGLVGGVTGYPALFTVDTNGESGALGFSVRGPSQAEIEYLDNGDGSADVKYYPTAPGEYAVHIFCDNEDIPNSPYIAQILPVTDYYPDKVEVYGSGIHPTGVQTNSPARFTVDTRKAGSAPLDVKITDSDGNNVNVNVVQKSDTIECYYIPRNANKHTVQVNYGGVATRKSPYRVFVSEPLDASKVFLFGPGIQDGLKANTPTYFNVDARYLYT